MIERFQHPKCQICGTDEEVFALRSKLVCSRCLSTKEKGVSAGWANITTPKTLDEFVGQDHIKNELDIMIKAHKVHGIPVQHVLFGGSWGLGKTLLSKLFANMISSEVEFVVASSIKNAEDLPSSKVVIVDETHTLKNEELLLTTMDKGDQTVIGATTNSGDLSGPLRSRFITLNLRPYSVRELVEILYNISKNLDYDCPDYVLIASAQRGKFVARTAILMFKRIYDRIVLTGKADEKLVDEWFEQMGIDYDGLDNADRAYLACLSERPIGLQNISALISVDKTTIEEVVEPYLLARGLVKRVARGRILGDKKQLSLWGG